MGLEKILKKTTEKWAEATNSLSKSQMYRYSVDVLSGWLYYTPTYALQELASGKDWDTVLKTRLIGLAAHAMVMRPIGLLRNYVAERWEVTKESLLIDKIKVNLVAVTPPQAIVYGCMLAGGMAWSGNYEIRESIYAWVIGVGLGALHALAYGPVQDYVRRFFKVTPAIF